MIDANVTARKQSMLVEISNELLRDSPPYAVVTRTKADYEARIVEMVAERAEMTDASRWDKGWKTRRIRMAQRNLAAGRWPMIEYVPLEHPGWPWEAVVEEVSA